MNKKGTLKTFEDLSSATLLEPLTVSQKDIILKKLADKPKAHALAEEALKNCQKMTFSMVEHF